MVAVATAALATFAEAREASKRTPSPPVTDSRQASERLRYDPGSRLYAAACASCHYRGAARADFGARSPAADSKPDELVEAILFGKQDDDGGAGTGMPAFGDALDDAQIASIARHLRSTRTTQAPWQGLEQGVAAMRRAGEPD